MATALIQKMKLDKGAFFIWVTLAVNLVNEIAKTK